MPGRKDERLLIDLPVRITAGGEGVIRNVSASGLYFETQEAVQADQTIGLEMTFLDTSGAAIAARCSARVVWVQKKGALNGVAVELVSLEFRRPPGERK